MAVETSKKEHKGAKIAVVRVRGRVHVRGTIADTLEMLHLRRVNHATVIENTPTYMGMIKKAKDFITWGEIDGPVFEAILEKWGRKAGDARLDKKTATDFSKKFLAGQESFKEAGIKPYFALHGPTKGHAKGGIKQHVKLGGVLGYRGKEINVLLASMSGLKDSAKGAKSEAKGANTETKVAKVDAKSVKE